MEVKNNPIQCPKCGQYYNPALHSSCPACGEQASVGNFPPTRKPESGSFNAPGIGVGAGSFSPTVAPGITASVPQGGAFNATIPVNNHPMDGPADPFSTPTVIGGEQGNDDSPVEPVVGWLVCVDGPVRGTDFRIHAGYNYIGRETGDIHIHGDMQISRQNHAMIAYDSSERTYYVGPSAGRNLIKVNGKTVLNAVEIKTYDIISIGTTKLMFVALCGEQFGWEKGPNNG